MKREVLRGLSVAGAVVSALSAYSYFQETKAGLDTIPEYVVSTQAAAAGDKLNELKDKVLNRNTQQAEPVQSTGLYRVGQVALGRESALPSLLPLELSKDGVRTLEWLGLFSLSGVVFLKTARCRHDKEYAAWQAAVRRQQGQR